MVQIGLDNIGRRAFYGARGLDITVKSAGPVGRAFAPSWGIVMGYKQGRLTWDQYRERYIQEMRVSYRKNPDAWMKVACMVEVVFLCYCRDEKHCHRSILRDIFIQMGAAKAA